jgi:hypothetical protein
MKKIILLSFVLLVSAVEPAAQSPVPAPAATETIQQAQSTNANAPRPNAAEPDRPNDPTAGAPELPTIKLPAGTPIEVEVAYTVSSLDIKPGEVLSFRVLIPIVIEGAVVIEKDALVTARVTLAKRGGHWGKAGRLAWVMEDVIAADNTRVLLDPTTHMRNEALWDLERKNTSDPQSARGSIMGTSHKGEVTTKTIVAAAIFPPLAPLALMQGFKRGENAVLPEGKRFVVVVRNDASVSVRKKS